MTREEARAWCRAVDAHCRDLGDMDSDAIKDLLKVLPWKDSTWLTAVHYTLCHLRNLVWAYGLQVGRVWPQLSQEVRRELEVAVVFDEYRIEPMDTASEIRFRTLRRGSWDRLEDRAHEN